MQFVGHDTPFEALRRAPYERCRLRLCMYEYFTNASYQSFTSVPEHVRALSICGCVCVCVCARVCAYAYMCACACVHVCLEPQKQKMVKDLRSYRTGEGVGA